MYFVMLLAKEKSLRFNNVTMLLLLGVFPRIYLNKLMLRSSTNYTCRLYNSNFGIPSLNAQKVRK